MRSCSNFLLEPGWAIATRCNALVGNLVIYCMTKDRAVMYDITFPGKEHYISTASLRVLRAGPEDIAQIPNIGLRLQPAGWSMSCCPEEYAPEVDDFGASTDPKAR